MIFTYTTEDNHFVHLGIVFLKLVVNAEAMKNFASKNPSVLFNY